MRVHTMGMVAAGIALAPLTLAALPRSPASPTAAVRAVTETVAAPPVRQPVDEVMYEAMVASASGRVEDTLRSQQDLYWSIATTVGALLVGVLAFLGYGQIRSMRDGLSEDVIRQLSNSTPFKDTIANQIEESVLKSLREAQLAIEQQIDFLNIRSLAERLENAEGFSAAQRDSLFEGLLRLKDVPAITQRPEFQAALDQVFSSFFQAGVWDKIDALETELRSTTVTSPSLTLSLLPSLGYRILSESPVTEETHAGLLRYIEAAKDLKFPEAAVPFELAYLLHVKPENWTRKIEIALDDVESMNNNDLEAFLQRMEDLSNPAKIAHNPQAYHARIAAKFAAVKVAYGPKLDRLATLLAARTGQAGTA